MLTIESIKEIRKNTNDEEKGYYIVFLDDRKVHIRKRRAIPALLTLIRYGEGCENDLTKLTDNLETLKQMLEGKIPSDLIRDSYSDANKPFSELWNEEGFVFITNPVGEKRQGSQKYVLNPSDHDSLFIAIKPPERKAPTKEQKIELLKKHENKCNICGSVVKEKKEIDNRTFYKDRVRLVWDHRVPIEKNGSSHIDNYQPLCFACNKYKWQICSICDGGDCSTCVLAYREDSCIIKPTGENISDRMGKDY
mgnify:CR=1 FL=1